MANKKKILCLWTLENTPNTQRFLWFCFAPTAKIFRLNLQGKSIYVVNTKVSECTGCGPHWLLTSQTRAEPYNRTPKSLFMSFNNSTRLVQNIWENSFISTYVRLNKWRFPTHCVKVVSWVAHERVTAKVVRIHLSMCSFIWLSMSFFFTNENHYIIQKPTLILTIPLGNTLTY